MLLQHTQCSSSGSMQYYKTTCGLGSCKPRLPVLPHQHQLRGLPRSRCSLRVQLSAAAAAAAPVPESSKLSLLEAALKWWDVGQSENDKNRQHGKLRDSLGMAWQLIAQEKKLMVTASFLMVAASVCELIMPYFYSKIIVSISKQGFEEAFKQNLVGYSAFALGYAVFAAGRGSLFGVINNKLSHALRYRLFGVLLREPTDFHDVNEPGQLISRLTSDCYAITRCIATNVNVAVRNLLQVIGGGAILMVLSPQLSGLCLAIFTILWGFTIIYGSYSRHSQRVVQDVLASSTACAEEALVASKVVRTFGTEQKEQDRYLSWLDKLYAVGMRQSAAWGLYLVAGTTAQSASIALSLLLGGTMVANGMITPEQLTSFMFYVQLVTTSSLAVCDQYGAIMEAVGASERVLAHLNDPPAPQLAAGIRPHEQLRGEIEFKGLSYTYPNRPDSPALSNIDLWLQPGKLTALVGASGSGKSTLVSLLQRLYDPTDGQVLIDGYDLTELDAVWYRSRLGMVSQESRLFSCSVRDNICYGCPFIPSDIEVEEAARAANAHDFIMDLPLGYNTQITDKLLSGGQRQRIAIARALVRKPSLLILDEATSALDAESEAQVQQALDRAMQPSEADGTHPRTVLVIAHRLSTVRNAHTIVALDKGKVAEQGSHAELVKRKGIYFSLVQRQQKGLGPADRDLSPRAKDPPMLSSRDWDYGAEGSAALANRDSAVSSSTSLRSGSPTPGIIEGSATSATDSARGFGTIAATPASGPKAPATPGHSRASTPMPSAASSLASMGGPGGASSTLNSYTLSVEEDDGNDEGQEQKQEEGSGGPASVGQQGGAGLAAVSANGLELTIAVQQQQELHAQVAAATGPKRKLEFPAGWRTQPQQQAATAPASNGSKYSSSASSNGNGTGPAATNGSSSSSAPQQQQPQQQQQQQPGSAANDIVPLNGRVSGGDRAAVATVSNSSSTVQQTSQRQ